MLVIDGVHVKVEASAFTLILYEDRFKGRRLLRDVAELAAMGDASQLPFSLVARLLWALAKTADGDLPDFYEWIKAFSIGGITATVGDVLTLLAGSIESGKKRRAAALPKRIWRRLTSRLTRPNAD